MPGLCTPDTHPLSTFLQAQMGSLWGKISQAGNHWPRYGNCFTYVLTIQGLVPPSPAPHECPRYLLNTRSDDAYIHLSLSSLLLLLNWLPGKIHIPHKAPVFCLCACVFPYLSPSPSFPTTSHLLLDSGWRCGTSLTSGSPQPLGMVLLPRTRLSLLPLQFTFTEEKSLHRKPCKTWSIASLCKPYWYHKAVPYSGS